MRTPSVGRYLAIAATLATMLLGACTPASRTPVNPATATPPPTPVATATAPPTATPSPAESTPSPTGQATATPAVPSPTPAGPAGPWNPPDLALQQVVDGLESPLFVGNAGDGSGRLFVIEQAGRIRIVRGGSLVAAPYLDIADRIVSGGEQGLLGLAFSRTFATDGLFYLDYTDNDGNTVISEFRAPDPAADTADPATERRLLHIDQPYPNHNGGNLLIARDGTLFVDMGDGGSGGDPQGNGQRRDTLLGKLLRVDPRVTDSGAPYGIPADNPWPSTSGIRPEIWAYGLRNPWRASFDRATGDLWIGDVGQGSWEEVDVVRAEASGLPTGGLDFGWNLMEGTHCYEPSSGCPKDGLTLPVAEYDHGGGRCSITGGFVARGPGVPGLAGTYVYGDYCSGTIWGLDAAVASPKPKVLLESGGSISSFGEDEAGDLYVTDIARGTVSRLVAAP